MCFGNPIALWNSNIEHVVVQLILTDTIEHIYFDPAAAFPHLLLLRMSYELY